MTEQVLVINTNSIVSMNFSTGFIQLNEGMLTEIVNTGRFIARDIAEQTPQYKQIIPYSILRWENQIFRYQRTRAGGEKRLFNQFSLGVGGHINPIDSDHSARDCSSIIEVARTREILEEFDCQLQQPPKLIGLINDNTNEVGSVHLGILFEYYLLSPVVKPNELTNFAQYSLVECESLISDIDNFETWSQIVILEYLGCKMGKA